MFKKLIKNISIFLLVNTFAFKATSFSREEINSEYKIILDAKMNLKDSFKKQASIEKNFPGVFTLSDLQLSGDPQIELSGHFRQTFYIKRNELHISYIPDKSLSKTSSRAYISLGGEFIGSCDKGRLKFESISNSYAILVYLNNNKNLFILSDTLFWKGTPPDISIMFMCKFLSCKMDCSDIRGKSVVNFQCSTHGEITIDRIEKDTSLIINISSFFPGGNISVNGSSNSSLIRLNGDPKKEEAPISIGYLLNLLNSLGGINSSKGLICPDIYTNGRLKYQQNNPGKIEGVDFPKTPKLTQLSDNLISEQPVIITTDPLPQEEAVDARPLNAESSSSNAENTGIVRSEADGVNPQRSIDGALFDFDALEASESGL